MSNFDTLAAYACHGLQEATVNYPCRSRHPVLTCIFVASSVASGSHGFRLAPMEDFMLILMQFRALPRSPD